jgi:hypothetical protein
MDVELHSKKRNELENALPSVVATWLTTPIKRTFYLAVTGPSYQIL